MKWPVNKFMNMCNAISFYPDHTFTGFQQVWPGACFLNDPVNTGPNNLPGRLTLLGLIIYQVFWETGPYKFMFFIICTGPGEMKKNP